MGNILTTYEARVRDGALQPDPAQAEAAKRLDELADAIEDARPTWFSRPDPPKGLYLWGGVGRGKSMLMDLFFEHAPEENKRRVHFHDFMIETHAFISNWRKLDQKARRRHSAHVRGAGDDPIQPAAEHISQQAKLLCFDEFHVTDIADAMILGRLFEQLWEREVVVVATSNRVPDDLYLNGVNRQLFKPFIEMIKQRNEVLELKSARDFRLERLSAAPVYYSPLGPEADEAMNKAWMRITGGVAATSDVIEIGGRKLDVPQSAAGCARFDFAALCDRPLGAGDYLALARRYHTLFLDQTPVLSPARRDVAKRFCDLDRCAL